MKERRGGERGAREKRGRGGRAKEIRERRWKGDANGVMQANVWRDSHARHHHNKVGGVARETH